MPNSQSVTPAKFRAAAAKYLRIINSRSITLEERQAKFKAYYQFGTVLLKLVPDKPAYGDEKFDELAAAIGHKRPWLTKVRAFARRYSRRDLKEVCRLADRLCWAHIVHLLGVKDPHNRSRLQLQAARDRWTPGDLRAVLNASRPPSHPSGRKLMISKDPSIALRQIAVEGEIWIKRSKMVLDQISGLSDRRLSSSVRSVVDHASTVARDARLVATKLERTCADIRGS